MGFCFSLGRQSKRRRRHGPLVATGACFVADLVSEDSAVHHGLGLLGTSADC